MFKISKRLLELEEEINFIETDIALRNDFVKEKEDELVVLKEELKLCQSEIKSRLGKL